MGYIDYKYKPTDDDIICDFYVEPAREDVFEQIAAESSIGTWTDIATMKQHIAKKMAARVFEKHGNCIKVAYPAILFEDGNMPQILSSVAGNIFGMKLLKNLRLEDIYFPASIVKSFKGPRFGVDGIRKLTRTGRRPLVGTIIKPKIGLSEKEHAKVAYQAWVGGCDIVKDDENLTSQKFNHFNKRVVETLRLRDKAESETGEKKIYMANVTAESNEMVKRAKFIKSRGGEYAMVDVITTGFAGVQTLREADLGLVLHGHRAMHAALTRNRKHGISMLALGKIFRLIGVDQLHIGTVVGKMEGGARETLGIEDAMVDEWHPLYSVLPKWLSRLHRGQLHQLTKVQAAMLDEWHHLKPTFPVCSGGLHPGHIPRLVELLGTDIIIQLGGGIHGHPKGTTAGATAARQAILATVSGIPLRDYAKYKPELKLALQKWK